MSDDSKLRELFGELQAHDEQQVPPFPWMRTKAEARIRSRRARLVAWGAVSAAAAIAILLAQVTRPAPQLPYTPKGAGGKPLEFLLRSPNASLLASVPDFDADPFARTTSRVPRGFE